MFKLVVLSCVVALAAANPSVLGPWGLGLAGPLAAPAALAPLGLGLGHGAIWGAPALAAYNYRGPLSLAPGQPANIVAADGRPLDTLSVNLDRAAHLTARAVDHAGLHLLKKRSAALLTPFASLAYSGAVIAPLYGSNYRGPLSLAPGQPANILAADGRPLDTLDVNLDRSAHLTAKALGGVHLLKKRSAPLIAPLGGIAYAGAPLIPHVGPLAYSAPIVAPYHTPLIRTVGPLAHYL
ncbi:uncharacterized protein LOC125231616 [Leguminivora glycinivorella]|uniref:uncharacterized protein LOC125231616 n=1 Tax=Leguminivora glycinivorella TaxID=1035111 RepID=UPI002010B4CD|nr:uncharacterized protein LOC125231616 [Leguminivora glycinivorella]